MSEKRPIRSFIWRLAQLICSVAFLIQIVALSFEQINPSQTETTKQLKQLDSMVFPLIIRLCFKNSFDLTEIENAGYASVFNYFKGDSMYDKSLFGWAGHTRDRKEGPGVQGKLFLQTSLMAKMSQAASMQQACNKQAAGKQQAAILS